MSYWCGEQLVVTVNGPAGRRVISLAQPFARVGSHPASEVLLEGASIASRSLYLHATSDGVFCLFLDRSAADPEQKGQWLAPDEDISVGPYRVRTSLLTAEVGDEVPTDGLAIWGSAPRPLPVLLVYCGDLLKDKRRFRARLSPIGRRPQCALQLKGNNVSGFHCVLFWDRQQLWCVDLHSSNGTELNGTPISCARVNIGDRLDVGEFGLVFQRLSYGRAAAGKPGVAPVASAADAQASLGMGSDSQPSDQTTRPPIHAAIPQSEMAIQPSAAPAIATVSVFPVWASHSQPAVDLALASAAREAEAVRDAENRQLRDKLNEEVARLAREREELRAQWERTSHELVAQVGQLHEESAKLTHERQALEQSRQEWQAEREALAEELARRTQHLTQLETELTTATGRLTQQLAVAATAPTAQSLPTDPAPEELARQEEDRQLRGQLAAEVERMARERQELKLQWERASGQLLGQIGDLERQARQLTEQREAIEHSRQEWQADRARLSEQLGERTAQLSRLEAELAAVTASFAGKLETLERQAAAPVPALAPVSVGEHAPIPAVELPPELPAATFVVAENLAAAADLEPETLPVTVAVQPESSSYMPDTLSATLPPDEAPSEEMLDDLSADANETVNSVEPSPIDVELAPPLPAELPNEPAVGGVPHPTFADRDQLTLFVSDRLVQLDQTARRKQLLWWSAGGVGLIAFIALAVTVWLWLF